MPYDVIGVDTSFWEGLITVPKTVAAGAKFIMPKAGEEVVDEQFLNTWSHAKGKLKRGAFWFLTVQRNIRAQAQQFADLLKDDPGEIEPYVDYEQDKKRWAKKKVNPVTLKAGFSHLDFSHLSGFIFYFEEALKAYYPKWPWKLPIGVYTGYDYWEHYGTIDPAFTVHPLWISEPDPVAQPSALRPWGFGQWRFWQTQFQADGPKFGTGPDAQGIDMDVYNGTQAQFEADYG